VLYVDQADNIGMLHAVEGAAPSLRVLLIATKVQDALAIERAIRTLADQPEGGLVVMPNLITRRHRERIFELAAHHMLPAIYPYRNFVTDGGLMSYGPDPAEPYRGAAIYVDRILKGEKVGDLPVQQPSRYELIVSLKSARAIDLKVSESFLAGADEVIE
jgi:putative ABC transport system substrate-binding protein